ncbi:MAG TPA: metalloregulator ArsR/SmtB family transcription factor [Sandaracinaceae bacterium LLY-WYZ-13_1]|nr:metalloregulator ArsR/SmtB family transcription factor [Sandaracinaceae bacterium LLY-WYZ-13_1]
MRDLIELHKALADETRIRILRVLQELGELCVCDVETGLDITQSRASRHMTQLRQAGLVEDRREGTWVYYRIAEPLRPAAATALSALREATRDDERLNADVEATRVSRRSPCR